MYKLHILHDSSIASVMDYHYHFYAYHHFSCLYIVKHIVSPHSGKYFNDNDDDDDDDE